MIHTAKVTWPEGDFFFASVDGELFLGISRAPLPEDEADIRAMFDTVPRGGGGTIPMRVTRGLLAHYDAEFHEV